MLFLGDHFIIIYCADFHCQRVVDNYNISKLNDSVVGLVVALFTPVNISQVGLFGK